MALEEKLDEILKKVDIKINGERPWDIQINNPELYSRIFRHGTIGIGEAYMEGWWDCDQIDEMIFRIVKNNLSGRFSNDGAGAFMVKAIQSIFNMQSRSHAFIVAEKHYNFGNDLFSWMLGPSLNYSCGYWRNADDLDSAQNAKMELIAKKLHLEPGMTVLDIGCGWGALGNYLKENYDVKVTGVSVSREQIAYAKEHFPENKWILDDYRSLKDKYDRIVSVGMFEHVGYKNYHEFMGCTSHLLAEDGLFLLHTIGTNFQRKGTDPWINKYIFPNGMIPSQENVVKALVDFYIMEDWQNFGADYDKTLMVWNQRFEEGCREGKFKCNEETRRMFRYYLLSCAGAFRARDLQLWQIVLSPKGVPGGYISVR